MKRFFVCLLTVSLLIGCAAGIIGAMAADAANAADFTMTDSTLRIKGSQLLAIDGCFAYDAAQYERNPAALIGTNDDPAIAEDIRGAILLHGGKGDSYTFTVDFGTYAVDRMTFNSYGLASKSNVIEVLIDGVSQGEAEGPGGNGWADADSSVWHLCTVPFAAPVSGMHTVTVRVTDSAPAWPANAYGNFTFVGKKDASTVDFTMTDSELNIPASALLAIEGCFAYDATQYERNAGALIGSNDDPAIPEAIRGQMLLHGGKGDSYTFTVDFGDRSVDAFGFYSYGAAIKDSRVGLELDGTFIADENAPGGNGWADADSSVWFYNEIPLPEPVSGKHTVRIIVTDSAPAWPANAVGNFLFLEAEAPEESDTFRPVEYETVPETEPTVETETVPETAPETVSETVPEADTETETVPATEPDTIPETTPTTETAGGDIFDDGDANGCFSGLGMGTVGMLALAAACMAVVKRKE